MKRICVFCGSSPGARPEYVKIAHQLGKTLAQREITLVYGGARVGTMGQLARATLDSGGDVIGVIPQDLVNMEVAFTGLPDLRVVGSMHERKALMAELSDGFIALPGGFGTFEEIFEALTWGQLGIHHKPCGFLNVCGYYNRLIDFLDTAVTEQFIHPAHRAMVLFAGSPKAMLDLFERYRHPYADKAAWLRQVGGAKPKDKDV